MANATWQALVAKHLLVPGFDKMGIAVSDAERMSMISGEHLSQVYYNAFADQNGAYSVESITAFLSQVSANPDYQKFWTYLNSQVSLSSFIKWRKWKLLTAGFIINTLLRRPGT